MGSKRSSKKIVGSKSSNDISKDLVQSILREETGDALVRRKTPGKKRSKKGAAVRKGSSSELTRPVSSSSRGKGIAKEVLQSRGTESVQQHMHPMDVARMQRHASNNVHVFAEGIVANSDDKFLDGAVGDDVTTWRGSIKRYRIFFLLMRRSSRMLRPALLGRRRPLVPRPCDSMTKMLNYFLVCRYHRDKPGTMSRTMR